ncbi:uncharacterized protein LOC130613571 [Hydractinia symbiolongicarpus]|uniref:uncharacterized protein LOC130613571 n=1 Tax=Hydractinia symbiolongicarpus TaxID=13093 RepID=UPI002549DA63|nr:uncharacterized protein LOC130613571 [Hydractinia symbiolongicarpus]
MERRKGSYKWGKNDKHLGQQNFHTNAYNKFRSQTYVTLLNIELTNTFVCRMKKTMLVKGSVVLILLLCLATLAEAKRCLHTVCSSNQNNTIRGCDRQGCGYHGAKRGRRKHNGVDIICTPESIVYSPFNATIVRRSTPYSKGGSYNNGLMMAGSGKWKGEIIVLIWRREKIRVTYSSKSKCDICFTIKLWYFKPFKTKGFVVAGTKIGISRSLPYVGITQHLHLRLLKNGIFVNPSNYIC